VVPGPACCDEFRIANRSQILPGSSDKQNKKNEEGLRAAWVREGDSQIFTFTTMVTDKKKLGPKRS
jgi:hypothetical protein